MRLAPIALFAALLTLAACGGSPAPAPAPAPALSPADTDTRFYDAWQQRLGEAGSTYTDPEAARTAAINLGHAICDKLAAGMDRGLAADALSTNTTPTQAGVEITTAVEFLCPDQANR